MSDAKNPVVLARELSATFVSSNLVELCREVAELADKGELPGDALLRELAGIWGEVTQHDGMRLAEAQVYQQACKKVVEVHDATLHDLDHGVRVLSEARTTLFKKNMPGLSKALGWKEGL